MSSQVDLSAYAQRIGFPGKFRPDLETLQGIVSRHTRAIPFENLDVLLKRPILLDPESLQAKLVANCRGGYCFEQNGLLLAVLEEIGFDVKPMAARVRLGLTRDVLPPRTHLFLRVRLDGGEWMADVGVGGLSLATPIRLDTDSEQATPHETRRIRHEGPSMFHQALLGEEWEDVHEFRGEEMPLVDRELANWWTSTNPTSKFSQNLFCARSDGPGRRLGLLNDRFTCRVNGVVESETTVTSGEQLLDILDDHFGLTFPAGTRFGIPF